MFDAQWEELIYKLATLQEDVNFAQFLDTYFNATKYEKLRKGVTQFVEGYDAAELRRVSSFALREEWSGTDEENQSHIKGGYSRIIHFMENYIVSSGGSILVNEVVKEVRWRRGEVEVLLSSSENRHIASRLIITVPLGVLQNNDILFSPPLPFPPESFQHLGFGGVIKFVLEFQHAFWEKSRNSAIENLAFMLSDANVPTWWTQLPDEIAILTGWLGGPKAHACRNASEEELLKSAIDSLAYIFARDPKQLKDELKHYRIVNWLADPFSRGAYAYATVESESLVKKISAPIEETLYFAGEAFYNGPAMGTVEAALSTGKQVAMRIIESPRLSG
jgi:monoamine oxidase